MMKSKYNKFILSVITDDTSILFDTTNDILEYPVPFGDYKIGDLISVEKIGTYFKKIMINMLKIIIFN